MRLFDKVMRGAIALLMAVFQCTHSVVLAADYAAAGEILPAAPALVTTTTTTTAEPQPVSAAPAPAGFYDYTNEAPLSAPTTAPAPTTGGMIAPTTTTATTTAAPAPTTAMTAGMIAPTITPTVATAAPAPTTAMAAGMIAPTTTTAATTAAPVPTTAMAAGMIAPAATATTSTSTASSSNSASAVPITPDPDLGPNNGWDVSPDNPLDVYDDLADANDAGPVAATGTQYANLGPTPTNQNPAPNAANVTVPLGTPAFPEQPVAEPPDPALPQVPAPGNIPQFPAQPNQGTMPTFPVCPGPGCMETTPGVYVVKQRIGNIETTYTISRNGKIFDIPGSMGPARADRKISIIDYSMGLASAMMLQTEEAYYDSTNSLNIFKRNFTVTGMSETMNWLTDGTGLPPMAAMQGIRILETWIRSTGAQYNDIAGGKTGTITTAGTFSNPLVPGITSSSFGRTTYASGTAVPLRQESWSLTTSQTTNQAGEAETMSSFNTSDSSYDSDGDLISRTAVTNYDRNKEIRLAGNLIGSVIEKWQSTNGSKSGYIKFETVNGDDHVKNVTVYNGQDTLKLDKKWNTTNGFLELRYENTVAGSVETITIDQSERHDPDTNNPALDFTHDKRSHKKVNAQGVVTLSKSWSDNYDRTRKEGPQDSRHPTWITKYQVITLTRSFTDSLNAASHLNWTLTDDEKRSNYPAETYKTLSVSLTKGNVTHSVSQSGRKSGPPLSRWHDNPRAFSSGYDRNTMTRTADGVKVYANGRWLNQAGGATQNQNGQLAWGLQQWMTAIMWITSNL